MRTMTNFIIPILKGLQMCFWTFLDVYFNAYFASQETRNVNLYYDITRNESWVEMLKLKLLIFVENGNLFSYKFDQPCFSIFLLIFKACATSNVCIWCNITWNF
jgi:hypothetical protein